ncbi:MAG: NnrU family protein [Ignavibacteria bacterium]|nr:NnrU family protein [Ignavibacteria bacterium]
MDKQIFIILLSVCIITHIIRSTYEILKHKKILKPNNLTFVIIFSNMALLWITWISLCRYDIYKIELPFIVNYFGFLLSIIGLIVFITALFTIKTLENYSGDLITKGIYSKIRHPMYLGFILWSIGFPIYFGALLSFCFSLLFISNILFWRHLEEIELDKRFPDFKDYRKNTIF